MSGSSVRSPLVIDASALVALLLGDAGGRRVGRAIGQADLVAPDLLNPEVLQSLRGLERAGKLSPARALQAVERLAEGGVSQVPTRSLVRDVWYLRANLSAYDGCYVALARALRCPLLTLDRALTRAPDLGITLISA